MSYGFRGCSSLVLGEHLKVENTGDEFRKCTFKTGPRMEQAEQVRRNVYQCKGGHRWD